MADMTGLRHGAVGLVLVMACGDAKSGDDTGNDTAADGDFSGPSSLDDSAIWTSLRSTPVT